MSRWVRHLVYDVLRDVLVDLVKPAVLFAVGYLLTSVVGAIWPAAARFLDRPHALPMWVILSLSLGVAATAVSLWRLYRRLRTEADRIAALDKEYRASRGPIAIPEVVGGAKSADAWLHDQAFHALEGKLVVGPNDRGGIYAEGTEWTDYVLAFTARITSRNLGVIFRATNRENFHMLQIGDSQIAPHTRHVPFSGPTPWIVHHEEIRLHGCDVKQPFHCWVVVRGTHVRMLIDGKVVYDAGNNWLTYEAGSVGFRCALGVSPDPPEGAEIYDVAVYALV